MHPYIAEILLHWVVLEVAVATVHLKSLIDDLSEPNQNQIFQKPLHEETRVENRTQKRPKIFFEFYGSAVRTFLATNDCMYFCFSKNQQCRVTNTVFAEINAHPEISTHQKQSFFKGGSTQNRWLLVGDFSKGGVHKTDGYWLGLDEKTSNTFVKSNRSNKFTDFATHNRRLFWQIRHRLHPRLQRSKRNPSIYTPATKFYCFFNVK